MEKIKIKLGVIGYLPFDLDLNKIKKWKSHIFEITGVDYHDFNTTRSDKSDWEYSDELLNKELPQRGSEDIFICVTNVPIDHNYYTRVLDDNRAVISYNGVHKYLVDANIPIENLTLRIIYASCLVAFSMYNNPDLDIRSLLHDDSRACIFDMAAYKSEVIYSLNRPKLCDNCKSILRENKVPNNVIDTISKELLKIKKNRYSQIIEFVKSRPVLSIIISIIATVVINIASNYMYDYIKKWQKESEAEKVNITIDATTK